MRRGTLAQFSFMGIFLASFCCPGPDGTQPNIEVTRIEGRAPAKNAHIVRWYVGKASPGSGHDTGSLHILYTDRTEIIKTVPAKQKSAGENAVYNQEGITGVKLAPDKRTIGWEEDFDNCCTSYSIPLALAVYGSGETVLHIQQGQMVWSWIFRDGGKQVAAVWGPTHGTTCGDYQLYGSSSSSTGRVVSEVFCDETTQSLGADAPEWARELDRQK